MLSMASRNCSKPMTDTQNDHVGGTRSRTLVRGYRSLSSMLLHRPIGTIDKLALMSESSIEFAYEAEDSECHRGIRGVTEACLAFTT